jgi:ATP-dependent Clp protease ATP-binding subunit ClpB
MTSNVGSDIILEAKELTEAVKSEVEKLLQKTFRPELLNRIDAIVFFKALQKEDVEKIAHIQLQLLQRQLQQKQITLTIDDAAVHAIAERGYEPEFGARPLKRAIQHYIAVPIAQYVLKHPDAKQLKITLNKNKEIQIS